MNPNEGESLEINVYSLAKQYCIKIPLRIQQESLASTLQHIKSALGSSSHIYLYKEPVRCCNKLAHIPLSSKLIHIVKMYSP